MRVVLKPVSHPQLGEISIGGDLFAIGRNEEPFAALGAAATRLSRRHARIFQEGDDVFVADLGSLNGTLLNERPLKDRAAPLHNNDLVTFGEEVSFRVEIEREDVGTVVLQPQVRLTLIPSDPTSGLESIAIERFPFLVARVESDFERYSERFPEALRKLSRRHAVIALKGGKVHVEDLASVNGTYVDGDRLDERARQLKDGDTVMFGSPHFTYIASIDAEDDLEFAATMMAPGTGTVISPVGPRAAAKAAAAKSAAAKPAAAKSAAAGPVAEKLAPAKPAAPRPAPKLAEAAELVLNPDPKPAPAAQSIPKSAPAAVQPVSQPAPAAAQSIPKPAPAAAPSASKPMAADSAPAREKEEPPLFDESEEAAMVSQGNRTRFVNSADSFINVFCADSAPGPGSKERDVETAKVETLKRPTGALQRLKASIAEFWGALRGQSEINRRVAWAVASVAFVAVAAVASSYLLGSGRREIKALLDDGEYAESASVANSYLAGHPKDREAGLWAEEALTKAVVPPWMELVNKGRYDDADRFLEAQAAANRSVPNSTRMCDTLAWSGRVLAHMADRGASGQLVLYRHEQPIKSLVAEWETDSYGRQQIMDQMLTRVPSFEPTHSRVFSSLRTLRSDQAVYVKAMEQLDASVTAALQRNDRAGIEKLIGDFANDFSNVGGLDALKEDLARYDQLAQLVQQKELLDLVRASRAAMFRTPSVGNYAKTWLAKSLPSQEVIDQHTEAAQAWRAGKHEQAIAILEPLARDATPDSWGEVAERQIARYRKVQADYEDLLAARDTDAYWDKLLLVWSSLRPNEDEHLMRALQPDFVQHREKVLPRLVDSLRRVQDYWVDYRNAGGISGVVRVEGRVSERFAAQAKRLSSAYDEVTSAARTYQLLQTKPPGEWQTLQNEVISEVQRQRRWLQDLNIVLEPSLLRAKLALLPQMQEQTQWPQSITAQDQD